MAVCLGCGMKVDSSGRIAVDNGDVDWPFTSTGCTDASSGTQIYCAPDGTMHGPPEKFFLADYAEVNIIPAVVLIVPAISPAADDTSHAMAGAPHLTMTVTNPSPCLKAQLVIDAGIVHGQWEKNGNGETRSFIFPTIDVTRDMTVGTQSATGPHQLFGHKGTSSQVSLDFQGSWSRIQFGTPKQDLSLLPGETATIQLTGNINVRAYNGNSTYSNIIMGVRTTLISFDLDGSFPGV